MFRLVVVLLISLICSPSAHAEMRISLDDKSPPAHDLMYNGQPIDPDLAASLANKNTIDLSRLNPIPDDTWVNRKESAVDHAPHNYPSAAIPTLTWVDNIEQNPVGFFRTQVQAVGANGQPQMYRAVMGINVHQAMVRSALLRKVGYQVQSPIWYKRAVFRFPSKAKADEFLLKLSGQGGYADDKRWLISRDDTKNELTLQDVTLEAAAIVTPQTYSYGVINPTHLKGRRKMRALLVPFVLVDIPENVDTYDPMAVEVLNNRLVFKHKFSDSFQETTLEDIAWISERIGLLTESDWKEIIAAGRYPPEVEGMLYEFTIARRNNLMVSAKVVDRLPSHLQKLKYDLTKKFGTIVESGRVSQERFDGYAQRFAYGDPDSPLKSDSLWRFARIELTSAAIRQALGKMSDTLGTIRGDEKIQEQRQAKFSEEYRKWLDSKPTKPFVYPVIPWSGFMFGVSASASRSLVAGSYYGNETKEFKMSLVDQAAGVARLTAIRGIDGLNKIMPVATASLSVIRSYVHVRPILSIEAADKVPLVDVYVPGFMDGLAKTLESSDDPAKNAEVLKKFLNELKENELFTISDTISADANLDVSSSITELLGLAPVSFVASISVGARGSAQEISRTTFTRENGKIKIYLQDINPITGSIYINVNYWLNLLRITRDWKVGKAGTMAFDLDESPEPHELPWMLLAMRGILSDNNPEILKSKFEHHKLAHNTRSDVWNGKFLFWRWTRLEEWHRARVQPKPTSICSDFDLRAEAALLEAQRTCVFDSVRGKHVRRIDPAKHERTLFNHRFLERDGKNYYALLGDVIDALFQKQKNWTPGLIGGDSGANPADSFFGNGRWSVVRTEAEITAGRPFLPVTTIERHWAGWTMEPAELNAVLDQIDMRVEELGLQNQGMSLINRDRFVRMKQLQLYRISSVMLIYKEAVDGLRKLLANSTDAEIIQNLLIPLQGQAAVDEFCREVELAKLDPTMYKAPMHYVWAHGKSYKCLMPWMKEVLDLRRSFPLGETMAIKEEQVKWTSRVLKVFEANSNLPMLIRTLGKNNLYYQITISGFKTGDPNGDTAEYRSETIGTLKSQERAGIFQEFINNYKIMSSEMNASYLSEGN